MAIQYRPIGFPQPLTCDCGMEQSTRELIIEAHRRRHKLTSIDDQYFSAISCDCGYYLWYVHLDYRTDIREINLLTDVLSLETEDLDQLYEETRMKYHSLRREYHIELSFPASLTATDYIQHHEIDHIKDDIYSTLPMIVIRPQTEVVENANLILVIPYESHGKIYGELKVNYNLAEEDRERITDLVYGIWDLTHGHYFGTLDSVDWDTELLFD